PSGVVFVAEVADEEVVTLDRGVAGGGFLANQVAQGPRFRCLAGAQRRQRRCAEFELAAQLDDSRGDAVGEAVRPRLGRSAIREKCAQAGPPATPARRNPIAAMA